MCISIGSDIVDNMDWLGGDAFGVDGDQVGILEEGS